MHPQFSPLTEPVKLLGRLSKSGIWLIVAGFLLLSHAAQAQIDQRFLIEYRLDRESVEVPFEYVQRQIVVRGQANDKKDLTFIFDTGASSFVVEKTLGVKGTHLADTQFHEAEGVTKAEAIWLDDLKLGNTMGMVQVHNLPTLLADLSQLSKVLNRKIDAVIGMNVIAGYVVEIDYAKKLLHFYNSRAYSIAQRKPDNKMTFLLDIKRVNDKSPIACVTVTGNLHEKYEHEFLLDTGFGGYASVTHSAAQESGIFNEKTPRIATSSFSVSRQFRSFKIRAPYLKIGAMDLTGRTIQVDIRNGDAYGQFGILGNRFLQNYKIVLDYQRRKLWLERVTEKEKEEPDETDRPSIGISIRADGKTVSVDRVTPNSPAARAGVKPGALIITINGIFTNQMTTARMLNLLSASEGKIALELMPGDSRNIGGSDASTLLTLTPSSPLEWKSN